MKSSSEGHRAKAERDRLKRELERHKRLLHAEETQHQHTREQLRKCEQDKRNQRRQLQSWRSQALNTSSSTGNKDLDNDSHTEASEDRLKRQLQQLEKKLWAATQALKQSQERSERIPPKRSSSARKQPRPSTHGTWSSPLRSGTSARRPPSRCSSVGSKSSDASTDAAVQCSKPVALASPTRADAAVQVQQVLAIEQQLANTLLRLQRKEQELQQSQLTLKQWSDKVQRQKRQLQQQNIKAETQQAYLRYQVMYGDSRKDRQLAEAARTLHQERQLTERLREQLSTAQSQRVESWLWQAGDAHTDTDTGVDVDMDMDMLREVEGCLRVL